MSRLVSLIGRRLRQRTEEGVAAVLAAFVIAALFGGLAAIGVDLSRVYVEVDKVQKAADAAALAGVIYMPNNLTQATTTAVAVATQNGYPNSGTSTVSVSVGDKPSQLKVTITSTIPNAFGASFGVNKSTISRSATADYTAPAPMGSPCNTFGNEPPSQPTNTGQGPFAGASGTGTEAVGQPTGSALPASPFPNCSSAPSFWAAVEGPNTDKVQGDRRQAIPCVAASNSGSTFGCYNSKNDTKDPNRPDSKDEYRPEGYFFQVHVEQQAVGVPISVQIYDPAFVYTRIDCAAPGGLETIPNDNLNDYATTDAKSRYSYNTAATPRYCSGDYNPGGADNSGTYFINTNNKIQAGDPTDPPTTTFVLRDRTDTSNPLLSTPITGCTKQFRGINYSVANERVSLATLTKMSGSTNSTTYNPELARVFHQWVPLCKFTPSKVGDYYLQVRTDVSVGGTPVTDKDLAGTTFNPIVYEGNAAASDPAGNTTTGTGLNSFALRAVPDDDSKRQYVAFSGNSSMPILQNAAGSTAQFNLIRALPNTAGQNISFDFFDAADGTDGGTVKVVAPADATGSIASAGPTNCTYAISSDTYTSDSDCAVTVNKTQNDGQLEHLIIPIPQDYNCSTATLGGCWFQVKIDFTGSSAVTDFTTWDASIGGDPVRLIK